jgi:hypothetical protein
MNTPDTDRIHHRPDVAAARNKLRQADFFQQYLHWQSREIAKTMWRASGGDDHFALEAFFSACLGAAQSCFYILEETGAKEVIRKWKNATLDQDGRTRFNAMMDLRGRDVHFGELPAEALPKMIEMDHGEHLHSQPYNPLLFGPRPMTEHTNPDGTTVRAYGLRGSIGLYVEICSQRIEATTACTKLLAQLQSLVQEVEAAEARMTTATGELQEPVPPLRSDSGS